MKEAAAILEISPGTIAFHKYRMMEVLGISTNAELLQYGITNHMVPMQESFAVTDCGRRAPTARQSVF